MGSIVSPSNYVQLLTLLPVYVIFFGNKVFADKIKDLKVRSSWI